MGVIEIRDEQRRNRWRNVELVTGNQYYTLVSTTTTFASLRTPPENTGAVIVDEFADDLRALADA